VADRSSGDCPASDGTIDEQVESAPAERNHLRAAAQRDADAHARDRAAHERDQLADLRDRQLTARDAALAEAGLGAGTAAGRTGAAETRALAAADRRQAASDRASAARDRLQAHADREQLLAQLAIAETDGLTGARTRSAGLADLEHEIDRARRTQGRLAVAYIDVVGLKAVNDTQGHPAGDALLQGVVDQLRAHLRPYDIVMRLGGDEFLCAMSGITVADARTRFREISAALTKSPSATRIRVGFADLVSEDSATDLIARADTELVSARTS
jgi:diguanylate cyclase (GGDEF)-like protein